MMEYQSEHPRDISTQLHARISFLSLATLAISEYSEHNDVSDTPAWVGLFYFTLDLLDLTAALKEKAV